MAEEVLITGELAGLDWLKKKGPPTGAINDRIDAEIGKGNKVTLDGSGGDTTTAAGVIDIDLTGTFSAITAAFITMTGVDGVTQYATKSTDASAGFLRFTVGDESGSVDSTAVTYEWMAIGTPA